jgi:hypothetical protein
MKKLYTFGIAVGIIFGSINQASAAIINFDDQGLFGKSRFVDAGRSQVINIPTSIGNVRFEGGVILTNATNLPANRTSIYGTASSGNGVIADPSLTNPIKVTFPEPINNFFLDVYNGNTQNIAYTVADNNGNSTTFTLPQNLSGGQKQIGFAATGSEVTITSAIGSSIPFDFFIDNIYFNEPLPSALKSIPEPTSAFSILVGLLGASLLLKRNFRKA